MEQAYGAGCGFLFDDGDTDFQTVLIGLGRRGRDWVWRLRQTGLADVRGMEDAAVEGCNAMHRLFQDILPNTATTALATPAGEG